MESVLYKKQNSEDSVSTEETIDLDYDQLYITPKDEKKLLFVEHLQLVDCEGELLDEVTMSVEEFDLAEDMFLVYQYSEIATCLLRAQSHVHRDLVTFSEIQKITQEKRTTILRITEREKGYKIFKTSYKGREGSREKSFIPKSPTDQLFSEGSNILLLRKLAVSRLLGKFRSQTLDREGVLQECEYRVEAGPHGEVVVRRTVAGEVLTTRLRNDGRIIEHTWSGSQLRLLSYDPEPTYEDETVIPDTPVSVPEPRADTTAYFEKKTELIRRMTMYLRDYSDVQDMISDFIKDLLFDKPDDIVEFADRYFSEFVGITREEPVEDEEKYSDTNVSDDTK